MIIWIVILNVIGFGRFVNLKGAIGIAGNGPLFSMFSMLGEFFSKPMGLLDLVAWNFFFHLFVFNQQIIFVVTSIDK
jgi:hypothetical protein